MLSDVLCSGNSVQQTYYEITEDECEQSSLVLGNITSDGRLLYIDIARVHRRTEHRKAAA
ncbi:Uncharacterized protein APZ42_030493 [Daphnia magna]|uniref:Uncharacterized protein n=1 Tax=Daphnia magna TaxID=35525 RepID=A0A164NJK1_9CRUS|nr:Uncharacterized protein APZ42_030493 [Daphnia magna]